jgi:branched-chain amino acid transport system substrate-binding protein
MRGLSKSFAAAAAFALCACAATPQQSSSQNQSTGSVPDRIEFGATLPLTGAESRAGGFYKEGYDLAFELANKDRGVTIRGKKVPVDLKLLDDTTTQATAVSLADRLINQDKVNLMLGTYSTDLVQAQSTVAEQNQIPYVNGGGAATEIYSRKYRWLFGLLAPITKLADAEMQWIDAQQKMGKLPKPAKIALAWENTSHGKDFRKGVTDFADKSKGNYSIVLDESFELNSKDFSALLGKVKAAGADFFLVDAHLPDYITMQRQYVTAGLCHKVVSYGARGPEKQALDALGQDNVNYILSAVWWNAQLGSKGLNKQFVDAFKAKYNRDPEWYQALSYETARATFTAIQKANSVDRDAVRRALVGLKMESILPGGQLNFPAQTGQQAQNAFVVQQNQGGKSPIIFPKDVANADGIAPNPTCK